MVKFDFHNRSGQLLSGRLELPAGPPTAWAIFAHCFTCSKNVKAASQVSKRLAELGIAVLRFDFTGLGNSEGDFANSNFSSNVTDLIDAAEALAQHHQSPSLLVGHSLGGAAVLMAAPAIPSVRAVATIGAPSEPAHVTRLIDANTTLTSASGDTTIQLGGRQVTLGDDFVENLRSHQLAKTLPALDRPLLILHSPSDSTVAIDNARQLFDHARHPKSFVSIDGADHMLSQPGDAQFVSSVLAAWAERYLPEPSSPTGDSPQTG